MSRQLRAGEASKPWGVPAYEVPMSLPLRTGQRTRSP
jgi:hypothetical protein